MVQAMGASPQQLKDKLLVTFDIGAHVQRRAFCARVLIDQAMQCLGIVDCTLVRTVDKDKKWLHRQGFARAFEVFGCPDASIEEVAHHGSTDPLIITAVLLARGIPMDTIKAQLPQALTREPHTIENQSETEACSSKCGDTFRQAIQLMINYISEPERAKSGGDGLECCPGVQCPSAVLERLAPQKPMATQHLVARQQSRRPSYAAGVVALLEALQQVLPFSKLCGWLGLQRLPVPHRVPRVLTWDGMARPAAIARRITCRKRLTNINRIMVPAALHAAGSGLWGAR